MTDGLERQIRAAAWSKARRMAWLMAPAPALYALVGAALLGRKAALPARLVPPEARDPIFFACVAAGLACVVAAFALAGRQRRAAPHASLSAAAQRFVHTQVLTLALAEVPALLGLVCFLLTGDLRRLIGLAAAGAAMMLFFLPRRATLEACVRRADPAGGRAE